MRKVSETPGMPQMAVGSSLLADASDLPALGSAHPMHGHGKSSGGCFKPGGKVANISLAFFFFCK